MKLGIISTFKVRCGLATYMSYLVPELQKLGNDVTVLAEYPDVIQPVEKNIDKDFDSGGIVSTNCWRRGRDNRELYNILKSEKFDRILINHQFGLFPMYSEFQTIARVLSEFSTKIVTLLHDTVAYDPAYDLYFSMLINCSDKLVVHLDAQKEQLIQEWKVDKDKIVVIPHGTKIIDIPDKQVCRKELNLPNDRKIFLSWGFMWESKGIELTLNSLKILKDKGIKFLYIHVGGIHPLIAGYDYMKRCFATANKLGITKDEFRIVGEYVKEVDIPYWFGSADVVVCNYYRGSLSASGAVHRLLSSKRPMIGTDDPCLMDIPELAIYRYPRFLNVEPSRYKIDPSLIANGLIKILDDKKLQDDLVKNAYEYALKTRWEEVSKQWVKVLG